MTLSQFSKKLNEIRAKNGWRIELELSGVWIITIFDKMTGKQLASTGTTDLEGIFIALSKPFSHSIWTGKSSKKNRRNK